jgi:hypothetical protein
MVQAGNLEIMWSGGCERGRRLLCAKESESHLLMKCTEMQRWREELLNSKWLHINEKMAVRKIL